MVEITAKEQNKEKRMKRIEDNQLPRVCGAIALHSSPAPPRGPLLPASPDLPGLRGADPMWLPLLLTPHSPHVLLVHMGIPPISLGIWVPHQWQAGALVVGRC